MAPHQMTSGVVAISYLVGLPYYLAHKPPALTAALVALGNYLLANVVFHYALAFKRGPGFPPSEDAAALPQVGGGCTCLLKSFGSCDLLAFSLNFDDKFPPKSPVICCICHVHG